ncbi:MAG: hypothetical protein H6573_06145 [Lewinellaceae bacterium]|nr:hypothetical protein [Phaeodactylibacter sp.]MCB0614332.1 hypothetical protein [Phaeodactylibacter sp.]MCB9347083.1 hypothetical protein [Lewinellaceae bacterium]
MDKVYLYLAFLTLTAIACSENGQKPGSATPEAFFDLKGYIEQEVQRLSESQPAVLKRIAIDGQKEERAFDSLDYSKELNIFSRSDINKVAWLDKYRADSTFQDGQLSRISYTSKEKGLKTQLLELQFSGGRVSRVHIQNKTESIVADVAQEMWYDPEHGYSLESRQSTALTKEKKVKVEVDFK